MNLIPEVLGSVFQWCHDLETSTGILTSCWAVRRVITRVDVHRSRARREVLKYGADHALRHVACPLLAEMILHLGADVDSEDGCAIQTAAEDGNAAVVRVLIENGADVHKNDEGAASIFLPNINIF